MTAESIAIPGQRLGDPRRLHDEIIEPALAGDLGYLDGQVPEPVLVLGGLAAT